LPTYTALREQPRSSQLLKMEGEGRGDQPDSLGDLPGRKPLVAHFDEEPKDRQTVLVGEGSKGVYGLTGVHLRYDTSNIIEMST
jgi:hypothetical protein